MLIRYLDLTKKEIVARLVGNFSKDIATFDEVERQALMMADRFTQGILKAQK